MPVRLAGKTLPTDSSEELLEVVSFFFLSFFGSRFLFSFFDSTSGTRADWAPACIGDFSGLKFLNLKIFFLGVEPSGPAAVGVDC